MRSKLLALVLLMGTAVLSAAQISAAGSWSFSTSSQSGSSALPTGFLGWQRIGDPNYTYSTTFGGVAGANNCSASFTTSCAYMNTTLLFSVPDSAANNVSGSFTNSPNQGLPNGWNPSAPTVPLTVGTNGYYVFTQDFKNLMNAQSEGILDPYRSIYYFFGGGHTDYYGNDIFAIDLTVSPFNVKRVKDAAWPVNISNAQNNTAGTLINAMGGQSPATAYAECAANTTTGLGCSPGSRHTTQAMQVVTGRTWNSSLSAWVVDHTKDFLIVIDGSGNPSGSTVIGTWTLPLGSPVTNATGWVANYQMTGTTGYHTGPGLGQPTLFGTTSAVDPRNGVVFATDPNTSSSEALWAFDRYGSLSAATTTQSQGTVNQWYRLTSANGFFNTQDGSAALWHDAATDKYWYIYAGGCRAETISNVQRTTNVATITYSQSLSGSLFVNGSTVYLESVSADSTFNGGPYTVTNTPGTTVGTQTVTFNQTAANVGSVASTGTILTCTKGLTSEHNGIRVADVTDVTTYGTASVGGTVASTTWTTNTMAATNTDLGDATLGNTCAEFLTGGVAPLKFQNNGWGDQSPGFVIDGYTGNIMGWPNEGKYLYEITPDPTNARLRCRRITPQTNASEDPPQSFTSSTYPTRSTWGAYANGKFSYVPAADAFTLFEQANIPGEVARIPRNIVTLFSTSGGTQTARSVSIPRVFAQGEILNYPQPLVDGVLLTGTNWQADVKNRWSDGSVKYAVVSLVVPSLTVAGNRITFQNAATGNNTGYLTQTDMQAAGYDFDSVVTLTGTATRNISARTMLADATNCASSTWSGLIASGHCFGYWLQGPVVTAVVIEDRSAARAYDTNTDNGVIGTNGSSEVTNAPLHPIFEAWFYPGNSHVDVYPTVENTWASNDATVSAKDQTYSLAVTQGSSSPTSCYTNASFTHIGRSRWHKQCSTGTAVGSISMDLNAAYMVHTKALPNWKTSNLMSANMIASVTTPWGTVSHNIQGDSSNTGCGDSTGCIGLYEKNIAGTGQHQFVGMLPKWDVVYLLDMADSNRTNVENLRAVTLGNADIIGHAPWYYREVDPTPGTGQKFDAPCSGCTSKPTPYYLGTTGSVGTFGRVVSMNARQQESLNPQYIGTATTCGSTKGLDAINLGTVTNDGYSNGTNDPAHTPDVAYFPYLVSGQYYYLENLQMTAAYWMTFRNPCTDTAVGSASREGNWSVLWGSGSVRSQAWAFRTLAYAAFIAPDGSAEKNYFTDKLENNIVVWEGGHNVGGSGSYPLRSALWTWGNTKDSYAGSFSGGNTLNPSFANILIGPSPIGQWRDLGTGFDEFPLHCPGAASSCDSSTVVQTGTSPWEVSFLATALGQAKDLGFSTTNLLQSMAPNFFHKATDFAQYNGPFALELYREPTTFTAALGTWATSANWSSGVQPAALVACYSSVTNAAVCTYTGASQVVMQDSHAYEGISALSYMTTLTGDGIAGTTAWNTANAPEVNAQWLWDYYVAGSNGSPVWSIQPR